MSEEKECLVCGKKITALNGSKISEGRFICFNCKKFSGVVIFRNLRKMSDSEIREAVAARSGIRLAPDKSSKGIKDKVTTSNKKIQGVYKEPDKAAAEEGIITVNGLLGESLSVDKGKREISYLPVPLNGGLRAVSVYRYEDIASYELLEDIASSRRKNICREMKVKINMQGDTCEDIYIHILNKANADTDGEKYQKAKATAGKILYLLDMISKDELGESQEESKLTENEEVPQIEEELKSVPDMLREYKKLLDEGVITDEEFEAKKAQLMGL